MRKELVIFFAGVISILGCAGCGDSSKSEQPKTTPELTSVSEEPQGSDNTNSSSTETDVSETEITTITGEGGGNPGSANTFAITVSELKYFYDNQEISMEDLINKLDSAKSEGEIEVVITDNHGAVKAFDDLTKMLDSKEIAYTINEPS